MTDTPFTPPSWPAFNATSAAEAFAACAAAELQAQRDLERELTNKEYEDLLSQAT